MIIIDNVQDSYTGLTGLELNVSYDFYKAQAGENARFRQTCTSESSSSPGVVLGDRAY
jgi:hypothetical protein